MRPQCRLKRGRHLLYKMRTSCRYHWVLCVTARCSAHPRAWAISRRTSSARGKRAQHAFCTTRMRHCALKPRIRFAHRYCARGFVRDGASCAPYPLSMTPREYVTAPFSRSIEAKEKKHMRRHRHGRGGYRAPTTTAVSVMQEGMRQGVDHQTGARATYHTSQGTYVGACITQATIRHSTPSATYCYIAPTALPLLHLTSCLTSLSLSPIFSWPIIDGRRLAFARAAGSTRTPALPHAHHARLPRAHALLASA